MNLVSRQINYLSKIKLKHIVIIHVQRQLSQGFHGCCGLSSVYQGKTILNYHFSHGLSKNAFAEYGLLLSRCLSSKTAPGIHENISSLHLKKRLQKKKRSHSCEGVTKPGHWNVVAYATADEYNLEKMITGMQQQELYDVTPVDPNCEKETKVGKNLELDVIHASARYSVGSEPREIFIFREGTIVVWNIDDLESSNLLTFLRSFEENSYDEYLVQSESDVMPYSYIESRASNIVDGVMLLQSGDSTLLDKYTFSNAMALSVKLGIWEASLDRYVDGIEYVTEDLKIGRKIKMSRDEVLRKTGELFALRHLMNLSSDLLDTPDFYWDRESQEALYHQTCTYFSIQRRTKVMNEKLNHCLELVDLLSSHLNDKHHVRLEWMIIILIMVEVGFEIIHYIDRFA